MEHAKLRSRLWLGFHMQPLWLPSVKKDPIYTTDSTSPIHHSQAISMASHWKSTPSYWCKFCETYVRDTPIERKNHEATGKHQGNIQRSLRDLAKRKERESRDQQRAKDEVARLNGLVGGDGSKSKSSQPSLPPGTKPAPPPPQAPVLSAAAQRKAHAEQLAALGVELPEELKKEVTGVGGWSTVSETVVDEAPKSLAEIKQEEETKGVLNKAVHKRKAEDDDEEGGEEVVRKRKVWGSSLKSYPGAGEGGEEDLDALLSGVGKKKDGGKEQVPVAPAGEVQGETDSSVKSEPAAEGSAAAADDGVKQEDGDSAVTAPPAVVFKKRKAKR